MVTYGEILSNRYLIQDELGSGGMSVVYRAMDLHTGGIVAIKIPHPFLLRSPGFLQRLKREAEIAVNLHSSRIARVTDISEHAGAPFLVLEYVPGESLSDLITNRGALPLVEALTIALDVARAMQTAHDRGVVHRDIKPQNIYITPSGDVKVLDFGIARMEGLSSITTASVFLGTPDYAAPERAEEVGDIRSDIYSLGVVLYEMLAGALPFSGSTPWKTMELHLTAPPPSLPDTIPAPIRTIVERCLEKDPADRYQTPAELAVALRRAIRIVDTHDDDEHLEASVAVIAPPPIPQSPPVEVEPPVVAPAPVPEPAAAAIIADEVLPAEPEAPPAEPTPSPPPVVSSPSPAQSPSPAPSAPSEALPPVAEPSLARSFVQPPASAPPGTPSSARPEDATPWFRRPAVALAALAVVVVIGVAVVMLVMRGGGNESPQEETATETGTSTSDGTSQDSTSTGSSGTSSQPMLSIVQPSEGANVGGPVTVQVNVEGATLKPAGEGDPEARHLHYFLDVDPASVVSGGKAIPIDQPAIVHSASTTHTFDGLSPGEHTVWVVLGSSDHIPLDPAVAGKVSFTVADPLANARSGDAAPIVFQGIDRKWRIYRMNGNGSDRRPLTDGANDDTQPALSPDGTRLAFVSNRDGSQQIYTMTIDGGDVRRVTTGNSNNHFPAWRPDGSEIVFTSNRDGKDHLWVVPAAGGEPRQLTSGQQTDGNAAWSPDGTTIAFHSDRVGGVQHIFTVDAGGGTAKQITSGTAADLMPAWSPDGKQIAFASYDGGQWDISVMNADGSNRRRLTNSFFNQKPSWSPDGKQILFHSNQDNNVQQVFVVPATGGTPRRLTEGANSNLNASWPLR